MNSTIYVIDDSPMICKVLTRFLQKWGYDVFAYEKAHEGFEALKEAISPFVVIIDWEMPELSGIEISKRIRTLFKGEPVYIILLTGRDSVSDLEHAFEAGVDDYIQKPFNERILKSRLSAGIKVLELENSLIQQKNHLDQMNTQLYSTLDIIKKDSEAGKKVQIKLLPDNKFRFLDYQLSYYYQPSMALSGDFLDFFVIDNRYLCLYFADVSGHGASSAFITILLKSFISNKIHEHNSHYSDQILDAGELLNTFNRYIIEMHLQKHLVMFYGIIDTIENKLYYSNAGQFPYPLIINQRKNILLQKKHIFVGIYDKANYKTEHINLNKDYKLVFFSDGILDILPTGSLDEKAEQLYKMANDSKDLDDLIASILKKGSFSQPPDDLTILYLQKGDHNE